MRAIILVLLLTGCSTAQVVTERDLAASVDAADVALGKDMANLAQEAAKKP